MRLYVGNLSKQITDPQLNALALPYGNVHSANIARTLVGGESKGFGFIEYETDDEARAAIRALNGKEVHGQALSVSEASAMKVHPWSTPARS